MTAALHRPGSHDQTPLCWRRLLVLWGLTVAAATVIVVLTGTQNYMVAAMKDNRPDFFLRVFRWPSILWYGWALLAPFAVLLAQRHPFTGATWPRVLVLHLAGCVAFYLAHVGLQVLAMLLPVYQDTHDTLQEAVTYHLSTSIYLNVFAYVGVVGVTHAVTIYQRYRQREVQAARLESELTRAQLQALKMQLHPHFLFNTLHAVSTLMYRDLAAADRMLVRLGELLRMVLDSGGEQEVPLWEEMTFLRKYLEIEQIRFADRLAVHVDVDPSVEDALVPNLVLQPLVENAIKHGVAPRSGPGRVAIRAWAEDDRLHLRVADDGPGLPDGVLASNDGVGLANTRARLDQLYGDRYRLTLRRAAPSGLVVDLALPLRRDSASLSPKEETPQPTPPSERSHAAARPTMP